VLKVLGEVFVFYVQIEEDGETAWEPAGDMQCYGGSGVGWITGGVHGEGHGVPLACAC
jgi:hypothetical protein